MKRVLAALVRRRFFACATTPAPAPAPVVATPTPTPTPTVETTPAPCDPGVSILNAVLWMQSSAEYRAPRCRPSPPRAAVSTTH
jgi:hypothetical protein